MPLPIAMGDAHIPKLLWDEIRLNLRAKVEENEIRRVVGSDLIDHNEDLHRELVALSEILETYKQESVGLAAQLQSRPKLPEPISKQLVAKNIRTMLLELEKSRLKVSADRATAMLAVGGIVKDSVANYVLSPDRRDSSGGLGDGRESVRRPHSSPLGKKAKINEALMFAHGKRPDTATSSSNASVLSHSLSFSRPTSASRSVTSAPAEILATQVSQADLCVDRVHRVRDEIRALLQEEARELKSEIAFLNDCLEQQHGENIEVKRQATELDIPSEKELKEVSKSLRSLLLHQEATHDLHRHDDHRCRRRCRHPLCLL